MRLVTLGVGAARSPRYRPAGLLIAHEDVRVMIDGGPDVVPQGRIDAWLLTDDHAELAPTIRATARRLGLVARVASFRAGGLRIEPKPVVHTNHPAFGYEIHSGGLKVVWAPEFFAFPEWAKQADLLFAEASSWNKPIRFRGGVGGHLDALSVQRAARAAHVKRLVLAHIGRPTIREIDRGTHPSFGELARDGQIFQPRAHRQRIT
jgi:ribonuclease BN (tRNA processing enzyme)